MKKAFMFYTSYNDQIKLLSNEQAGILLKAICAYECEEDLPNMDDMTMMAFSFIKTQLDIDDKKYQETVEKKREAGKRGGRPKKQEVNEEPYGLSENHVVSEKPKEKEIDKEIEKENTSKDVKEKKHYHGEKVLLTDAEYERLKADYGEEKTEKAIAYLNDYIVEKQYKSKSHNLALRRWVFDAVEEQDQRREKMKAPRSGTTKFNQFEQRKYDYDALEKMLLGGSGA